MTLKTNECCKCAFLSPFSFSVPLDPSLTLHLKSSQVTLLLYTRTCFQIYAAVGPKEAKLLKV